MNIMKYLESRRI